MPLVCVVSLRCASILPALAKPALPEVCVPASPVGAETALRPTYVSVVRRKAVLGSLESSLSSQDIGA